MQHMYKWQYVYVYLLLYTLSGGLKSNHEGFRVLTQQGRKFLVLITSCSPIVVNGIFYTPELRNMLKDQMYLESKEKDYIFVSSYIT